MNTTPRDEDLDTVSSASRQHYIDTGRYLTVGGTDPGADEGYDPERDDFDDEVDTPPDYEGDRYTGVNTTPRGRAIDRHEDAICAVLAHCDEGMDLVGACEWESGYWNLTSGRLMSLVQSWCAVAGIAVPS